MPSREFYDIHCHALTLSDPSFINVINTVRARRMELLYSQFVSMEYLSSSFFRKGGEKLRNMLSVMENSPSDIFFLMEDDLRGKYKKNDDELPLIVDGKLTIASMPYRKLIIAPLLMDFGKPGPYKPDTYYDSFPAKRIEAQIMAVLLGVKEYRRLRPDGFLEIHPFLGINPANYTPESMQQFLDFWFSGYLRGRKNANKEFAGMSHYKLEKGKCSCSPFAGIKLYPPLGFDPWPEPGQDRETVKILYAFTQKYAIPITTHCDDGGFRILPIEQAMLQTAPSRFKDALARYPDLLLNFAHLGSQYSRPLRRAPVTQWRDEIFAYMREYPGVYADFSFNGVDPEYYAMLSTTVGGMDKSWRDKVESRIMFGSDFMVNLFKIRSYADYYRVFEHSALSGEQKYRFASENPRRFLFGD
jgi:hypothetical protein